MLINHIPALAALLLVQLPAIAQVGPAEPGRPATVDAVPHENAVAGFSVTTVDVPGIPRRIDAADLDGDGDIDLFVVGQDVGDAASLQVLLNEHGHFRPGWHDVEPAMYIGTATWDVDLADTDGDGDADVVYVVPFGEQRQRFNDGLGHFDAVGSIPTFSVRYEHEPADMDGDGNVDLVYYEPDFFFDIYFGTLKGNGNGTFSFNTSEIGLGGDFDGGRIALGDVTGDGWRDAAFTSDLSGLWLMKGKAPAGGTTIPGWIPQFIDPAPCAGTAIADLDGDGRLDIAATVPSLDSVEVVFPGPGGMLGSPIRYPAGASPGAIIAADLDLDGKTDMVAANPATATVSVLRATGHGLFELPQPIFVGRGPADIVAADLDGDGDVDLVVPCAVAGNVAVLFNETL